MFVVLDVSLFWLLAFLFSHLTKNINLDSLFAMPPIKIWAASIIIAFIELVLLEMSDYMILVCYHMAPDPGTAAINVAANAVETPSNVGSIELVSINAGTSGDRGSEMPSAGLTQSG